MSTFNNTPISINHLAEDQIKMYKQEITNVFFFFIVTKLKLTNNVTKHSLPFIT